MKVTRDVVLDLWPAYESGTASEDTRALVEAFLAQDPEFARGIREGETMLNQAWSAVSIPPSPDAERAALARIQLLLRLRYYFLALACLLTVSATLLRQYRRITLVVAIVSVAAWIGAWMMARNPRAAALLPSPRVETPAQTRWRVLRSVCLAAAFAGTLFSALLAPRLRLFAVGIAGLGVLAWLALGVAERVVGRRRR